MSIKDLGAHLAKSEIRRGANSQAYEFGTSQESPELDVLQKLHCNLEQLEDLFGRLRFMLGEIKSILPKG